MSENTAGVAYAFAVALVLLGACFCAVRCTESERAAYIECVKTTGKPLECERAGWYQR